LRLSRAPAGPAVNSVDTRPRRVSGDLTAAGHAHRVGSWFWLGGTTARVPQGNTTVGGRGMGVLFPDRWRCGGCQKA